MGCLELWPFPAGTPCHPYLHHQPLIPSLTRCSVCRVTQPPLGQACVGWAESLPPSPSNPPRSQGWVWFSRLHPSMWGTSKPMASWDQDFPDSQPNLVFPGTANSSPEFAHCPSISLPTSFAGQSRKLRHSSEPLSGHQMTHL